MMNVEIGAKLYRRYRGWYNEYFTLLIADIDHMSAIVQLIVIEQVDSKSKCLLSPSCKTIMFLYTLRLNHKYSKRF